MENKFESLMNGKQKGLAIALAIGAIGLVLFLIGPILAVILKSLVMTIVFGVAVAFLIYNWESLFFMFKLISWNLTKKLISIDRIGVLEQSLRTAYAKQDKMAVHHNQISTVRVETERRLESLLVKHKQHKNEALGLEKQAAVDAKYKPALDLILHKIKTDEDAINNLLPRLEFIKKGADQMGELRELLGHKVKSMEYTVASKREENETLKTLHAASNTLRDFMNDNNKDAQVFNEGLAQTERSISEFISSVENLDRDLQPALLTLQSQRAGDVAGGANILEEYKASLAKINFDSAD